MARKPDYFNPGKKRVHWEPPKPWTNIAESTSTKEPYVLAGDGSVYGYSSSSYGGPWSNEGTLEEFTVKVESGRYRIRWIKKNPGAYAKTLEKKSAIRSAGLKMERKFFGPRGIFAKAKAAKAAKNPLRKSKPEWYYDAGMRSYLLDLGGSVYILSPTGSGFKYSLSVGGEILHYSKTYPEIEQAMDAIDHGQGKKFKRPPGIYGSTRKNPIAVVGNPSRWVDGYIVLVAGKVVAEVLTREEAERIKGNYRKQGYGPVHIEQGPINKLNPGETWHRVKAQWAKGKRDRFKETTYAHGFWSGEKIAHEDSAQAAKRMRSNPITIIGNPPVPEPQFTSWSQVVTYLKQEGWAPLGKKHVAAFGRTVGSLYQVIQLEARAWRVLYRTFLTPGASPMLSLGTWKQLDVAMVSANRQANDWVGKKNPPSEVCANVEGVIYDRVVEIAAEKTGNHDLKGRWYHPFTKGSEVLALDNGDILIHSKRGKKLWKED